MPFLPIEFKGAQKEFGAHLPPDNVSPLVDQDRQVPVALNPFGIHGPDDGFRSWADDQRFFQFLSATVCDYCQFRRKAFNVFFFFGHKGLWDEQRESSIDMTSCFETFIKSLLDVLPERPTIRAYHHAAANWGVIS